MVGATEFDQPLKLATRCESHLVAADARAVDTGQQRAELAAETVGKVGECPQAAYLLASHPAPTLPIVVTGCAVRLHWQA